MLTLQSFGVPWQFIKLNRCVLFRAQKVIYSRQLSTIYLFRISKP